MPTPSAGAAPRKKILCFHGVAQSGRVFARRCASIVDALSPLGYEFVFLTAPHDIAGTAYTVARQADWVEGDVERSWWKTDDETGAHAGIETSMQTWGDALREHGPVVGALGFSQGGCAAASLACMLLPRHCAHPLVRRYLPASHPPLDFLVLFSANPFRFPTALVHWLFYPLALSASSRADPSLAGPDENLIHTPTLFFYGMKEWAREPFQRQRQQFLISRITDVRVVGHPWKHTVPRAEQFAEMIKGFIEEKMRRKRAVL